MKAKIGESGDLLVWRAGRFKYQWCPYGELDGSGECSDDCPHFREVGENELQNSLLDIQHKFPVVKLTCGSGKNSFFYITEDDRPGENAGD